MPRWGRSDPDRRARTSGLFTNVTRRGRLVRAYNRHRFVFATLGSLLIGLLFLVAALLSPDLQRVVAWFLGGAFAYVFLVELMFPLRSQEQRADQVSTLLSGLNGLPDLDFARAQRLLAGFVEAAPRGRSHSVFGATLDANLDAEMRFFGDVAAGRVTVDAAESRLLVDAMNLCVQGDTVFAVSRAGRTGSWWQQDVGREYRRANDAAINREVRVVRLFVGETVRWPRDEQNFNATMQDHLAAGVDVRYVREKDLAAWGGGPLRDMTVFPSLLHQVEEFAPDGTPKRISYSIDEKDILGQQQRLGGLLDRADIVAKVEKEFFDKNPSLGLVEFGDEGLLRTILVNGMPPAFVKEYPSQAHCLRSAALNAFESSQEAAPLASEKQRELILRDHARGDQVAALQGDSRQLEMTLDRSGAARHILTTKRVITYGQRKYIVGWYLPVDVTGLHVRSSSVEAKVRGGQPVLRLIEVPDGEAIASGVLSLGDG